MKKLFFLLLVILFYFSIWNPQLLSAETNIALPRFSIGMETTQNPSELAISLQLLALLTILSLAPSIIIMVTSFTRIVIVLSFVRQAVGTRMAPPNQLLVGFALFLTFFVMSPVLSNIYETALDPYFNGKINQQEAFKNTLAPIRVFMFKQTRKKDLALFVNISKIERPKNEDDIPTHVLIPAFIISELKTAFQMGFALYVPFLLIDLVIASLLMSMGMMMLPPIMISLPFKLLLFVMSDGWNLITRSLVLSFS